MRTALIALGALAMARPLGAEISAQNDIGFASHNEAVIPASPAQVWTALIQPARYWNREHTWSNNAANLSLQPVAGGCFCEKLPAGGSVQHMRVIYAAPNSTLKLSGALGPLQSEALTGTLTIALAPQGSGTKVTFDYVVGGFMRFPVKQIAPAVDGVIREQLSRLAALFRR